MNYFIWLYWGLNLVGPDQYFPIYDHHNTWYNRHAPPWSTFYVEMRVSWTFCLGWPWPMFLPIFTSRIARIMWETPLPDFYKHFLLWFLMLLIYWETLSLCCGFIYKFYCRTHIKIYSRANFASQQRESCCYILELECPPDSSVESWDIVGGRSSKMLGPFWGSRTLQTCRWRI
jgi:hypothetical protein